MVLKERVHALADGARARRKSDEMPDQNVDEAARRTVIHEWENWAALHSDDLQSPGAVTFFFNHLQEKKSGLLSFDAADKCQIIQGLASSRRPHRQLTQVARPPIQRCCSPNTTRREFFNGMSLPLIVHRLPLSV
jgi:hypothetical protein